MYLRVTDRCNMICPHCMYSCTASGTLIDWKTFQFAVDMAVKADDEVYIGGGEPTLHPQILDMVDYVQWSFDSRSKSIVMITNGTSNEKLCKELIKRVKGNQFYLDVSIDRLHDKKKVKPWWREWFNQGHRWGVDVDRYGPICLIDEGRAQQNHKLIQRMYRRRGVCFRDELGCYDVRIDPDGSVWAEYHEFYKIDEKLTKRTLIRAYEDLGHEGRMHARSLEGMKGIDVGPWL